MTLGWLMHAKGMGLHRAYEQIKARHSFLWPGPNAGFMQQLSQLEARVFPASTPCDTFPDVLGVLEAVAGAVPKVVAVAHLFCCYAVSRSQGWSVVVAF